MNAPKRSKGFQAMTPEKRAEIASIGGKAAHRQGKAHQFTSAEAAEAGRKGGLAKKTNRAASITKTT